MLKRFRLLLKARSLFFTDLLVFAAAFAASYAIRFEGSPVGVFSKQMLFLLPYFLVLRLICFVLFSVYSMAWVYISIREVFQIATALLPISVGLLGLRLALPPTLIIFKVPLSIIVMEFLLSLFGTAGIRILRRFLHEREARVSFSSRRQGETRNVILIGAGDAGNILARELQKRLDLGLNVVGFIDDDTAKRDTVIQGIRVLGNSARIPEIARRRGVTEAIITIANASSRDIRRFRDLCEHAGIKIKIIPGLFELLHDEVKITKIRDISIEDVLGRSIIRFENRRREIFAFYGQKRILVSGAGGSIGSELCRQLAAMAPAEIALLDKDEFGVYSLERQMRKLFPRLRIAPVIADVRDRPRLASVFAARHPQIIFHAAAHKHVPLMEVNACEAILNNVLGTKHIAELAASSGVEHFIFISTDKAVNPTSVMGASKKIGEILIQELAANGGTRFSCVRFGNVLGTRGSVVPLFREQIAGGGPITVTHPEVRRYFMSIFEAVQLIIQAGTIGRRGEIFVLDMGEPIKIVDLAKHLIKLSGYREDEIEISYIGLRPGEKLVEEILIDEEKARLTEFEKIFISPPIEVDRSRFAEHLAALLKAAEEGDEAALLSCLKDMGIGFRPGQNP